MNSKTYYEHELAKLKTLADLVKPFGSAFVLDEIEYDEKKFPIYCFEFGPKDNKLPLLMIVGGVHGLEFIGSQITSSLLESLIQMLHWDKSIEWVLKHIRIVFYPMANPVGIYLGRRSNGNGVDLMRNSPIEASVTSRVPFISGHRFSPVLPWYRGPDSGEMEKEVQILNKLFEERAKNTPFVLALDIHSGFGTRDRLWFPYAHSQEPFHHMIEVARFKNLFDITFPNHVYLIEPQSRHYTTHGDIWDNLFHEFTRNNENSIFLPFCLEIGSWNWVKKNPKQFFSLFGMFNPVKPHRLKRTLRRHHPFFDFMIRATLSWKQWSIPGNSHDKAVSENEALKLWYQ